MTYTQTYQINPNTQYYSYPASDIRSQVANIGRYTTFSNIPGQLSYFNMPLVNNIVSQGAAAIPHIINLLNHTTKDTVIAEAALISQQLAEKKTPGYEQLYAPLVRHSYHPCPVVQVMIAGAFRAINEPSAAGPLTRMLYNDLKYPPGYFTFDPTEELAGSLIELIAKRASYNTINSLEPRLNKIESKLNINA